MKYYVAKFVITGADGDMLASARDVLAAIIGDVGFEAFEETAEGLNGYIQRETLDTEALDKAVACFPFEGVAIGYSVDEVEDKDYNETWEETGFEPVVIKNKIVIHDTEHTWTPPPDNLALTPDGMIINVADDVWSDITDITIDARQAFGTGTHETTRMIIGYLADNEELRNGDDVSILDCGCGTGILSITASKLGAGRVVAYDIDEWSVRNTRHNAELNGCPNIEVIHGRMADGRLVTLGEQTQSTDAANGKYNFILANLNRNILLGDMPAMRDLLKSGGHLVMSGFYGADHGILLEKANSLGLTFEEMTVTLDDWCMLVVMAADAQ